MREKIERTIEKIENRLIDLCVFFLIVIIAIIVLQILTRRLGVATSGTEEMARYCYVLFVFILWPIASRRGQDLRITVLFDFLTEKGRKIAMGLFHIVMAGYSCMFLYSMYINMSNAFRGDLRGSTVQWLQMWWIYAVILCTFFLLLAANLLRAYSLMFGPETVPTQEEQNRREMEAETEKIRKELEMEERRKKG